MRHETIKKEHGHWNSKPGMNRSPMNSQGPSKHSGTGTQGKTIKGSPNNKTHVTHMRDRSIGRDKQKSR